MTVIEATKSAWKDIERAQAALDRKNAASGPESAFVPVLKAVDVHALAEMHFKERTPLLGTWLHSQDLCMVYAPRGVGKTHFNLGVAFAVATGGTFLGWQAPQAHKVLYLDGEMPGASMQRRLLMHAPDTGPAPGYLRVFTPDLPEMEDRPMPDLSTTYGQAEINDMIEDDTALVIVDNLSAWARTGRENDAESWHPIADWILQLRRRGIAVILVHHSGKGGQQRGTSKKEDLLDSVIGLSRPVDYEPTQGAVFVVEFTKGRNLKGNQMESLEVTLGGTDDRAEWTCTTVEGSTFKRVVALANDGLKPADIAAELEINKSTVSRHLKRARDEGLLTIRKES